METDLPKLIWIEAPHRKSLQDGKDREAIALAKKVNLVCRGAAFVAWDDAEKVAITQDEVLAEPLCREQVYVFATTSSFKRFLGAFLREQSDRIPGGRSGTVLR